MVPAPPLAGGRELLGPALARSPEGKSRSAALVGAAALASFDGDTAKGRRLCEEVFSLLAHSPDPTLEATAKWMMGVGTMEGDRDAARILFQESLESAQRARDGRGMAWAYYWLANLARGSDDLEEAARWLERCLAALEQMGDIESKRGDAQRAEALYRESLAIFEQAGDRDGIARALNGWGRLARQSKDLPRSIELHERALEIRKSLGITRPIVFTLLPLARVYDERGEAARGLELLDEALRRAEEADDTFARVAALEASARSRLEAGDASRAARLLGEADRLRGQVDLRRGSDHDRDMMIHQLERQLGKQAFDEEWKAGRGGQPVA